MISLMLCSRKCPRCQAHLPEFTGFTSALRIRHLSHFQFSLILKVLQKLLTGVPQFYPKILVVSRKCASSKPWDLYAFWTARAFLQLSSLPYFYKLVLGLLFLLWQSFSWRKHRNLSSEVVLLSSLYSFNTASSRLLKLWAHFCAIYENVRCVTYYLRPEPFTFGLFTTPVLNAGTPQSDLFPLTLGLIFIFHFCFSPETYYSPILRFSLCS